MKLINIIEQPKGKPNHLAGDEINDLQEWEIVFLINNRY